MITVKFSKKFSKSLSLLSCLTIISTISLSTYAQLTNFGDPNTQTFIQSIKNRQLHILQLGDSHTAADHMTDGLRQILQQRLGNGGMGWGMPMYFSGQRMANISYDNQGFTGLSSRNETFANYTLGGFTATPKYDGASLMIKSKRGVTRQKVSLSIRQSPNDGRFIITDSTGKQLPIEAPIKNNQWQIVNFSANLPFTIHSENANQSSLGGWWFSNEQSGGAIVSPLGINGAELSFMNRWQGWQTELGKIRPNLVILAYGTNEAHNNKDSQEIKQLYINIIQQIRQTSPQTAVMIVSAPESLKNTSGSCGTRPSQLTAIQQMQQQVAGQMKTLYWDWQQAMGGYCSMKSWINQGKAHRDGVHFLEAGYVELGNHMAFDLLNLSPTIHTTPNYQQPSTYYQNQPTVPTVKTSGSICSADGKQCRYF